MVQEITLQNLQEIIQMELTMIGTYQVLMN